MPIDRRTILGAVPVLLAAAEPAAGAPAAPEGALPGAYRYRLGAATLTALHEGTLARPLEASFIPNAPIEAVRAAMAQAFLPTDRLDITFTTLLIEAGGHRILVDTGFADNGPPGTGGTLRGLAAAGIERAAIDTVVMSHFHLDHVLGLRLKDGSLTYPNAEVLVPEAEWAFWMDEAAAARAPERLRPNFAAVRRIFGSGGPRVTRFGWDREIRPGLTALPAPGHTPGHTVFLLESEGARLLHLSDVTNHPALFVRHPDWSAVFDIDADQARATRRTLLDRAAGERLQVAFYHAPFPATGHVARAGDGYAFVPVQWGAPG
ncbi:MBL fold metallo-hydrolase [Methylobacterium planeticum]|uniref:MBL fold metallo-hydrolase n=1 Tax=Methylobacterium planeticum TaxID=2615211 RepID=A0A6N6MY24_9HYPH|nr:MBL fold metallo-hydrolase [Methylobacterium planeticum]KAB1074222.1 MBL fold metallo-hydrolase [Methylobacterium planeticum]